MKYFKILSLCIILIAGKANTAKADTVDNFQIYIKKVLVLNDSGFGSALKTTNLLILDGKKYTDTLLVNFNHCNSGGSQRRIRLMNHSDKIIFEWTFVDKEIQGAMALPISQLLAYLKIESNEPLELYYFDNQVPNGSFLTLIKAK